MLIKTDIRTINGEHNGVPFSFQNGYLTVHEIRYAKLEIKQLVELANLLEIEGFKLAESLPQVNVIIPKRLGTTNWTTRGFDACEDEPS